MKASIRDLDTFKSIRPLQLISYLRGNGWQEVQRDPLGAYWEQAGGEAPEILVPLSTGLRDFPLRMAEALQVLEQSEQRSQLDILEDLRRVGTDVLRSRLMGAASDGSISVLQGEQIYSESRNLMLAAACAALGPRQVHAQRKPEKAMEFVRHARLGIPTFGSYVVTILSPVSPRLEQAGRDLFGDPILDEEPFERRVMATLAKALQSAVDASVTASSTGSLLAMYESVPHGVSANLCEAIIGLYKAGGENSVEFTFSWEVTRGTPPGVRSKIVVDSSYISVLDEAVRAFRDTATIDSFEVVGMVKKLEHEGGDRGRVTIVALTESGIKNVAVYLEGKDHEIAVAAYRDRISVSCIGELTKAGRSWELKNPRQFGRAVQENGD
jgi:hypothetical protein